MNKQQEQELSNLAHKYPSIFALLGTMEKFKGQYDLPTILENLDLESYLMIALEIAAGGLDEIGKFKKSLDTKNEEVLSEDENKMVDNLLSLLDKE